MSLYPTDSQEAIAAILAQAELLNVELFFTSLHIPEATGLAEFIKLLGRLHEDKGYKFFADISPLTLERLNIPITDIWVLKQAGIYGVRIDFGFSLAEIIAISKTGLEIAINASTVTDTELKTLAPIGIIGWHNYYPRPETGMSLAFFLQQEALLAKYGVPSYAFMPGVNYLRAPLHLQLPMLEQQRFADPYVNFMLLAKKYGVAKIFIAEGTLDLQSLEAIKAYKDDNIITLNVDWIKADVGQKLLAQEYYVRIEQTDTSWRLEDTRGLVKDLAPRALYPMGMRTIGDIYMDNNEYGRYAGEIHFIHTNMAGDKRCNHVGAISILHHQLLAILDRRPKIKLIRMEQ
ncbi:MAG: MupG family TIM beta-alpha barrel fold protein [Culicoidibacterales bacterium]